MGISKLWFFFLLVFELGAFARLAPIHMVGRPRECYLSFWNVGTQTQSVSSVDLKFIDASDGSVTAVCEKGLCNWGSYTDKCDEESSKCNEKGYEFSRTPVNDKTIKALQSFRAFSSTPGQLSSGQLGLVRFRVGNGRSGTLVGTVNVRDQSSSGKDEGQMMINLVCDHYRQGLAVDP